MDRVLALVRADAGRRGHPPLRGDARGGAREPRVRGGDPPPARMPQCDCRPLRACPRADSRRATPPTPTSASRSPWRRPSTRPSSSCSPGTRLRPRRACARRIARSRRWASARSARRWRRPSRLVILEQGRDEEAEALAEVSARLGASGDLMTQVRWRRVRARVLARRAEIQAAEALAREALTIAEATDFVNERADALIDLSHVLEASRRRDEAVAAASGALRSLRAEGKRGRRGRDSIAPRRTHKNTKQLGTDGKKRIRSGRYDDANAVCRLWRY